MNNYDLFDALGSVDEDLLERSERKAHRRLSLRKAFIAAAAVMLLAVTVLATPTIINYFFHTTSEQTSEGVILQGISGKNVVYADMYRIDFSLTETDSLPTSFEEYMIPGFFETSGWYQDYGYDLTEDNFYPSMEYMWFTTKGSNTWVVFEQAVFQPHEYSDDPIGTNQFYLAVSPGYAMTEETLLIGENEMTCYLAEYNEQIGERHIFWTDGRYAYHLTASPHINPEVLGEIISSITPVTDNTGYLKTGEHKVPAPLDPIEIYHIPTAIPDGFRPTVSEDDGYQIYLAWGNDHECIIFTQTREDSIDVTLANYEYFGSLVSLEEVLIDGQTVYFATLTEGCAMVWETEDNAFTLEWYDNEHVGIGELTALMDSMISTDDISAYMIE